MQYVTSEEFLNSAYGIDLQPGADSLFATSGQVDEFLSYVTSLVELYCGRSFATGAYEQITEGGGSNYLFLDNFPVLEITSMTAKQTYDNSPGQTISEYFLFKKSGKVKSHYRFSRSQIYTINYIAGYEEIPQPIKMATMMWANIIAQGIDSGNVAHVDGGQNVQFRFNKFWESYADPRNRHLSIDVPPTVAAILNRYKSFKGQ